MHIWVIHYFDGRFDGRACIFKQLYHAKTWSSESNFIVGRVIHYNNKYMIWITQWSSLCTRHGIIKITSGTVTTELIRMPSWGNYTGTLNGTYYAFLTFHFVYNIAICACNQSKQWKFSRHKVHAKRWKSFKQKTPPWNTSFVVL